MEETGVKIICAKRSLPREGIRNGLKEVDRGKTTNPILPHTQLKVMSIPLVRVTELYKAVKGGEGEGEGDSI